MIASLGMRRELFVDDWLIMEMRGTQLKLHRPERREVTFTGSVLHLNARTSAAGSIQVDIQDGNGRPVPGFTMDDMAPWFADLPRESQ